MVGVFERVYEVGPLSAPSPTTPPAILAEYVSLDAEMGFITDHTDVMLVVRDVLAGMTSDVAERAGDAAAVLSVDGPNVPDEIPWVHFEEAQHLVEAVTGERVVGEPDLAPGHERWLEDWARRQ